MKTFFSILFTLEVIWIIILLLISIGKESKIALALFLVGQYAILSISVFITIIVLVFNFLEKNC